MWFIVLCIILLLVVLILAVVASQRPNIFRVERQMMINAKAEDIYPYLINVKKDAEWSPWMEMEPDAEYSYSGPEEGVGATVAWKGKKVGEGKSEIIEAKPPYMLKMDLEFYKPMKAKNICIYTLKPEGNKTEMIWVMEGKNSFIGKFMSLFMDCEKMCGDQFIKGMNNLKEIVENPEKQKAA